MRMYVLTLATFSVLLMQLTIFFIRMLFFIMVAIVGGQPDID